MAEQSKDAIELVWNPTPLPETRIAEALEAIVAFLKWYKERC